MARYGALGTAHLAQRVLEALQLRDGEGLEHLGDAVEMWGRYGGGIGEIEAVRDLSTSTPRRVLVSWCAEVCRVTSWKTVRCRRHSLPAAEHTTVAARGLE